MIHIEKDKTPPSILIQNKDRWTTELKNNLVKYGEYEKIPLDIKNSMWVHYRHPDIKEKLFASSHQKCAFCEAKPAESGNIEVEHFKPKSLYPELAFEWDNFLPVCRKCNVSKSNHDTGKEPIVNPCSDDPETIFTYNFINIIPTDKRNEIADRTIEICDLNSERLYDVRSKLLKALCSQEKQAKAWIKEISLADTQRKRITRINKLRDSMEIMESLTNPEQPYAGFCRYFINSSEVYQEAKKIVSDNLNSCERYL